MQRKQLTDWRQALRDFITDQAKPLDKFGHQPRLYALTQQVGSGLDYDDDVVYAAAWLHDLGVFIGHRPAEPAALAVWDNVHYAIEQTPPLLLEFGFPDGKIEPVIEAIRTHQASAEPTILEATILRDADILEQLGAIGILRAVCKVGRDTRYPMFSDAIPVLRAALENLPGQLRLDCSRILAQPRVHVLRQFLENVEHEAGDLLY